MRSQDEVCNKIVDATDEERGDLIRRVRAYNWTEERKKVVTDFIMLLGLLSDKSRKH